MNKRKTKKKFRLLHLKKRSVLGLALLIVIFLMGMTTSAAIYNIQKPNSKTTNSDSAKVAATSKPTISPSTSPSPTQSVKVTQPVKKVPFQVSRVYFSQSPHFPTGVIFYPGTCTIGQRVTYIASSDVTATAAGTATYHWEVGDGQSGDVTKYGDQQVSFAGAGTKSVQTTVTYTVPDSGSGNRYGSRQYVNLVVTSPNDKRANGDAPNIAFAYIDNKAFFIWGSYIDPC